MAKSNTPDLIKKPNIGAVDWTEEQLLELMKCEEDPLYFMSNYMKVQHPVKGALQFKPYEYQERMVRAFHKNRYNVILAARQLGKCFCSKIKVLRDDINVEIGSLVPLSFRERVVDYLENLLIEAVDKIFIKKIAFPTIKSLLWLIDPDHRNKTEIAADDMKKFTHVIDCDFKSDFGRASKVFRTVPYEVWELKTETKSLLAADRHRVIRDDHSCAWIEDLKIGDLIKTNNGIEAVTAVRPLGIRTHMYCMEINTADPNDANNHLYYSDGILSHNTTCASGFIIWKAMFTPDSLILITANKYAQALEIMDRVRFCYENLPDFIRAGVKEYNKGTLTFDNGSKIMSSATSANAGRGLSISLLYCLDMDTTVTVRDKITNEIREVSLGELYTDMSSDRIEVSSYQDNIKYEILTPHGWCDFKGIASKGSKATTKIALKDGRAVKSTLDHTFYSNGNKKEASEFMPGDILDTDTGNSVVISNEKDTISQVYDIIEVDNSDHKFFVNGGIVTKNCDEFAAIPKNIASEFMTSISPILATGGSSIITSTPKSDEDEFAQIWRGACDNVDDYGNLRKDGLGKNGYYAMQVPWWEHPERDEEWARPFRESLGEARFKQEFENQFITDDETLINPLTLARLKFVEPLFYTNTVKWYYDPEPNKTFLVGLDPAMGTGGDYAAIQVFQLPEMRQIAEWQHNLTSTKGQVKTLLQVLIFLEDELRRNSAQMGAPEIFWTVENNSLGEAVLQIIEHTDEAKFPGQFVSEKKKKGMTRRIRKGMTTTHRSKLNACARLKSLVESDRMEISSRNLVKELKTFVSKENSFSAKPGEHDDLTMALILIVRMLEVAAQWSLNSNDLQECIDEDELMENEPMPVVV